LALTAEWEQGTFNQWKDGLGNNMKVNIILNSKIMIGVAQSRCQNGCKMAMYCPW